MRKIMCSAVALLIMFAASASAHELIIKPTKMTTEKGEVLPVELQSTHVFIVKEEMEDISFIKAGIYRDGKLEESKLTGNEPELCIDFSVEIKDDGSSLIAANKIGDIWSVTNEGGKPGPRKKHEDQGLKVVRSTLTDKFAKAIVNSSEGDKNFSTVIGQELEIVPVTNPANAAVGGYFQVKILFKGEPASLPVWATYDGFCGEYQNTYAYYTESGSDGVANIKITSPGLWIVRSSIDREPGVEGEYDSRSIRSILTFQVK
ncbi:MAG: DUF4198 domain-containing protein [Synergistaceae bacterium]|nr:DUF4198 domain-containing protein [Synergistaceae bacterium]